MITTMKTALYSLREAVESAQLHLETPAVEAARGLRAHVLAQLDDYILPRYDQLDAPLLAVVGGSTGAGKSTLVNALVGAPLTRPGALRPTTRDPVLIHHPSDAHWFTDQRVFPSLPRVHSDGTSPVPENGVHLPGTPALRLQPFDGLHPGLALLDAPDVDSVVDSNRHLAAQLLAAADMWIFVTTANRYADAVPWELLRDASRRQVVVAIVLDRVPPPVMEEVSHDLAAMLAAEGLARAPLFLLAETELDERGMLPRRAVADLANWLEALTVDAAARSAVIRQTLAGATVNVAEQTRTLAEAADNQARAATELEARVNVAYSTTGVMSALADGAILRGEVLARWQDFIGTGEFFRGLESRVGRIRDQVTAFITGKPQPEASVKEAIGQGLHAVMIAEADAAAGRAQQSLRQDAAGRTLLAGRDWSRATPGFEERAAEQIRQWQGYLIDLVRTEGQDKRTAARMLAFGVNAAGVVLMIVVFASTAGLLGGEIAIAGGTAVLAQKLLEAIFGDQAVRRLAESARRNLEERVDALFAAEKARFTALLGPAGTGAQVGAVLRNRADAVLELTRRPFEEQHGEVAGPPQAQAPAAPTQAPAPAAPPQAPAPSTPGTPGDATRPAAPTTVDPT